MKYLVTTIALNSTEDLELTESILSYLLMEIGYDAFEEEGSLLKAYIPKQSYSEDALNHQLKDPLIQGRIKEVQTEELPDINWNEEWEKHYYKPVVVQGGRLAVRASFHEPVKGVEDEIIIDPKMAFGTGNHATTLGMLRLLLDEELHDAQVIDMGCGSGILGILAMKLGARHCTSIDIDEWSIVNAEENARVNGVSLSVFQGDASLLSTLPKANLLLANINRNIILEDLQHYSNALTADGVMLLSGFLVQDLPSIEAELGEYGYQVSRILQPSGDWVALRATR
ncbi:MAG: 50S ribosomal protein L11 methyltransferase [Porphyromonas sp.]|nr:50S ribosomal protein L11 methyltransferase [Porphyromonas sp.]